MTAPRDETALRGPNNLCVVCGKCVCEEYSLAQHAIEHLAAGEAIVVKAFGQPDRVVPTSSQPSKDTADEIPATGADLEAQIRRAFTLRTAKVVRGASYRPKP